MSDKLFQEALPGSPLARLRLLIALDALLVSGSVSGAAKALEISTPAASRLLSQLRQLFDDEILMRSGRRMVPTPLAEGLRLRVRALAAEAQGVIEDPTSGISQEEVAKKSGGFSLRRADFARRRLAHPPLALQSAAPLDLQAEAGETGERVAQIGGEPLASERLARCIATLGAGPGRSRPLDLAEAEDAFSILLAGRADPVQIGALMGLLNYRGVSPLELAGMVRACRRDVASGGAVAVDLDWPGYLSPFNRNPPWFLLAAKLLGQRGLRIVLHGFGPELSPYDPVLEALALPRADALSEAGEVIERAGVVFLPLPAIGPQIQALINLYPLFQMRMPLHLALQLLNPLSAPAIMMGLPRATLPTLHQEAAGLLGMGRLLSIDSHRDVAQATPHRVMTLSLQEGAQVESLVVPPQSQARPASPPGFKTAEYCAAVWSGQLKSAEAEAAVVDSAAMGLIAMRRAPFDFAAARSAAQAMWQGRNRELS